METMETTLLEKPETNVAVGIPMLKQQFLNWNGDDEFLYEFDTNEAIPIDAMKNVERPIVQKMLRRFTKTQAYQQMGELLPETKCWLTDEQMRIPDLAFFTTDQIRESGAGEQPIPAFVVELISPSDTSKHIEKKIIEYFNAGVQVVWHVHPDLKMVRVFTSPRHNVTCFEQDTFNAAPALPDLQFTVEELFTI